MSKQQKKGLLLLGWDFGVSSLLSSGMFPVYVCVCVSVCMGVLVSSPPGSLQRDSIRGTPLACHCSLLAPPQGGRGTSKRGEVGGWGGTAVCTAQPSLGMGNPPACKKCMGPRAVCLSGEKAPQLVG